METSGQPNPDFLDGQKTYKTEHFPGFDIVVNLDSNKEDQKIILDIFKKESLSSPMGFSPLGDVLSLSLKEIEKVDKYQRFFIKIKNPNSQKAVDFITGRTTEDYINPDVLDDFDKKSRYAKESILSEIVLSKKIKEIVASDEVQNLAKKHGFEGMKFSEPIIALVDRDHPIKYLIYRNIKKRALHFNINYSGAQDIVKNLRKIFLQNNIFPADLREEQFLVTQENDHSYIVLIDTEAYTKIDNQTLESESKTLSFEEFSHYTKENGPRYMNFGLFFVDSWTGGVYRKKECYKKFAVQNPSLAETLLEKVKNRDMKKRFDEAIRPFEVEMYEAFKIMCKYVKSPYDLFS